MKRILAVVTAFEKIKDEKDLTDLKLLDILVSLYKTGVKLGRKARNDEDPPKRYHLSKLNACTGFLRAPRGILIESNHMKKDNKLTVLEDPNKDNDNIINFSEARKGLITGGPPGDENWLKLLSVGTVFLCKRKTDPKEKSFLDLFCVLEHKVMSSNLMQKLPNGQQIDLWFPTLNFSRDNTFNEVIAEVKVGYDEAPVEEQDKTPEITDGNSSRSV